MTYRSICITMYDDDLRSCDKLVQTLRKRGHTRMNRSMLIRIALRQLDVDNVPEPTR